MLNLQVLTFCAFALLSASVWYGFVWVYDHTFGWTQWIPGINIIYFPHGLRMILVILFKSAGALGIVLSSSIIGADLILSNPELGISHSILSGLAVWLAVQLMRKTATDSSLLGQPTGRAATLDGRILITLAFASAVFNSGGHCLASYLFDPNSEQLEKRFAVMFTGDLFGAIVLLYALRWLVLLLDRNGDSRP